MPQPLAYLVRDVARRHGLVRVGHASSFLRAEDPAALAELLVDRRLAGLGLRRLAPTVLAADADGPVVLDALRRVGPGPRGRGGRRHPAADRAHAPGARRPAGAARSR